MTEPVIPVPAATNVVPVPPATPPQAGQTSTGQATMATVGNMPAAPINKAAVQAEVTYLTSKGRLTLAAIKMLLEKKVLHLSQMGDDALQALNAKLEAATDTVVPFVDKNTVVKPPATAPPVTNPPVQPIKTGV